jgi:cytochrome c oxidase assembly factor CtaG
VIDGLPFSWHVPAICSILALYFAFWSFHLPRRRRVEVAIALAATAAVLLYPFGDLARSVSLTAAVVQRLVIMLVLVPVLMLAVPPRLAERITRPAAIDRLALWLSQPALAILVVTVVGTVTLVPGVINWAADSALGNAVVLVLTCAAGVVMWIPGLGTIPGTRRLSPAGRAGYLFVASLVVTSLSIVWIFARHPMYAGLTGQQQILGVSALVDQQVAGFVAKLGAYAPLWAVSFFIFAHAEDAGTPIEESPLHWVDVERRLLRVDRQRARQARRHPGMDDVAS